MPSISYRAEDNLRRFENSAPIIGKGVMIDPSAVVLGDLELGDDVSIWPQASVRADIHSIHIGERSNIQDNAVLHVTHASSYNPNGWPLVIGADVTVGHSAVLHGCTIGKYVLIGMGAIVMDGSVVEDDTIIAANALVTQNQRLQSGFIYAGSPAEQLRPINDAEKQFLRYSSTNYVNLKNRYLELK